MNSVSNMGCTFHGYTTDFEEEWWVGDSLTSLELKGSPTDKYIVIVCAKRKFSSPATTTKNRQYDRSVLVRDKILFRCKRLSLSRIRWLSWLKQKSPETPPGTRGNFTFYLLSDQKSFFVTAYHSVIAYGYGHPRWENRTVQFCSNEKGNMWRRRNMFP